jgi:NADPH:quinone reductase-like Zn-dependent oxidoreductase
MKAILGAQYGPPEVLAIEETEQPTPKDDEVLVSVHAASVNPTDWHRMTGTPPVVRKRHGEPAPTNPALGTDVAGTVVAVGLDVTHFAPRDEVFGWAIGSFAEFARAAERNIAHKPSNTSFEAAAALPVAGLTALQGLRDHGRIAAGQRVLVNGASGGVGTMAVQLARVFGAYVTGVCSTRNVELVRSIGANDVVDYTRRDFTEAIHQYDLILDTVGNHIVEEYERCLKPQGTCVLVASTEELRAQLEGYKPAEGTPQIVTMLTRFARDDLLTLAEYLGSEKVVPVIDKTYGLDQVADAMAYLGTKRARGKLVITVAKTSR